MKCQLFQEVINDEINFNSMEVFIVGKDLVDDNVHFSRKHREGVIKGKIGVLRIAECNQKGFLWC